MPQAKSWKTTTLGVLGIVATVISVVQALLNGHPVDVLHTVAALTLGTGLIKAKDSDVTGGTR